MQQTWIDRRALNALGAATNELNKRVENLSTLGATTFVRGNLVVKGEITSQNFVSYPSTYTSKIEEVTMLSNENDYVLDENGVMSEYAQISEPLEAGEGLFTITYEVTDLTDGGEYYAEFRIGESGNSVIVRNNGNYFNSSFVAKSNFGDTVYFRIARSNQPGTSVHVGDGKASLVILRTNVSE